MMTVTSNRTMWAGLFAVSVLAAANSCGKQATNKAPAKQGSASKQEIMAVAKGMNQFALDLYKKLSTEQGNLFFSSWSISMALAMTHLGAKGQTAAEMEKTLHFPKAHLDKAFGSLSKSLTSDMPETIVLDMANRLFPQVGYPLLPKFMKDVARFYGSTLQSVDYRHRIAAVATINKWVREQTAGRIDRLFEKPEILPDDTKLVLVNSIFFKGIWEKPFEKNMTRKGPFFISVDKSVPVDMMHGTIDARYAETPTHKVIELDYSGHRLSMVVLLPKQKDGLASLEKGLTIADLTTSLGLMASHKVQVSLPKFHLDRRLSLIPVLKSMGMKLAFDRVHADFGGMTKRGGLYIDLIIHQANCDVDEQGTVAAAATAAVMRPKGLPHFMVFKADHPFVFFIRDRKTGAILFMGRVVEP